MKLLSVDLARAIWLGHVEDFNPKGINLYKFMLPFLIDTYKFKKVPPTLESIDQSKGISFEFGEFEAAGEDYPVTITFTVYPGGFSADSRSSTRNSEAFLIDLFNRFSQVVRIPHYESIIKKKAFVSRLYVHTKKSIELLNPKLSQLSEFLSHNVEDGTVTFQTRSISIWPDQTAKVPPLHFTFEPTVGDPFSENRYFSVAPLPTDRHLELLDKLESILS